MAVKRMNKVFKKLRRYNKQYYVQFLFCITLSIMLITSFAALLYSPTIQLVLPAGGDSRMQVNMIFIMDIISCIVFNVYVEGLFLRYKSKEMGVFLALGIKKKELKKVLCAEMRNMCFACTIIGMLLGCFISEIIWKVFCLGIGETEAMHFQFSLMGFVIGLLFSVVTIIIILQNASKYMKNSNLLDLLHATSKSEPLRSASAFFGAMGIILMILGIFMGYVVPIIVRIKLNGVMPKLWGCTYLLSFIGIYMVFVYAVSCHKKGKNIKKYYDNLILYSTMKFQGKQTVKNMCVLTIMVAASLFAVFYPMSILVSRQEAVNNPIDFSIPYKLSEDEITKEEIYKMAEQYDVNIVKYDELVFSELIGGFVERDLDEEGKLFEDFIEKDKYCEFINESMYSQITGVELKIEAGGYYLVAAPNTSDTVWEKKDDLRCVTNSSTEQVLELKYCGYTENTALNGTGTWAKRYVLNDEDYEYITEGLPKEHQVMQILFNLDKRDGSYEYCEAIYEKILEKASKDIAVSAYYDEWQEQQAREQNIVYDYADRLELEKTNNELMYDWKYYPYITVYIEKTFLKSAIVYFLLFSYIAFICIVAVGIIAYTRAITIGMNCNELFMSLHKLGANNVYILNCIKKQLSKIFLLPTVIGSLLMLLFKLAMIFGNDRYLSGSEIREFGTDIIIVCLLAVYMYIMYLFSVKKVKKMISFLN